MSSAGPAPPSTSEVDGNGEVGCRVCGEKQDGLRPCIGCKESFCSEHLGPNKVINANRDKGRACETCKEVGRVYVGGMVDHHRELMVMLQHRLLPDIEERVNESMVPKAMAHVDLTVEKALQGVAEAIVTLGETTDEAIQALGRTTNRAVEDMDRRFSGQYGRLRRDLMFLVLVGAGLAGAFLGYLLGRG